jgi:hypothetical protein
MLERSRLADVGRDSQRTAAAALDLGCHLVDELDAAPGRGHVGARLGEADGDGAPDAARAADDDRRPAAEIEERH